MDNLAPYAALKFARPGDVLVVAVDGDTTTSIIGDILLGMAKNAGIVAAVTDGLVRDIEGINQVGIPLFAQGLTPNSPFKDGPGEIGGTISLGGSRSRRATCWSATSTASSSCRARMSAHVGAELAAIADKGSQDGSRP